MANITKRIGTNGDVSYRIRVVDGKNKHGGVKQQSMTWRPDKGMTEKQIEKELKKVEVQFEEKVKNGKKIDEHILFGDYADNWLMNKQSALAPRTYADYSYCIGKAKEEFKYEKMCDIKSSDISRFYNNLRKDGVNKNNGKGLSPKTIKNIHTVLKDIFDCAVDVNVINRNPLREKGFATPKVIKHDPVFLEEEEIAEVLELLDSEPMLWKTLTKFLMYSGLRRGEAIAIEWKDINFETGDIRINKIMQYVDKNVGIIEKTPKTLTSIRTINVPQDCLNFLLEYKEYQKEQKKIAGDLWHNKLDIKGVDGKITTKNNDKVFTGWDGLPLFPDSITTWIIRFAKRHNLKYFTPHSLRHTYVSLLISAGTPVKIISEMVGHSNASTTLNIYSHLLKDDKKMASDMIGERMSQIKR